MDFFYNSVCHVCKEYKQGIMKRCSACKFITYCSKEHQISDWKSHKQICQIVANSHNYLSLDISCSYQQWRSYRTKLKFFMNQMLGREILPFENQMWMFPRACSICYSRENLRDCENCLCVAYCSDDHKIKHEKLHKSVCSDLKLCLEFDRFYLNYGNKKEVKIKEIDNNIINLPGSIQEALKTFVDMSIYTNPLEKICITDIFATMLTIIYGLEKSFILINRYSKVVDLVIHIVGADVSELSIEWNSNFMLLNSWIRNLSSCKLIFIGPDSDPNKITNFKSCNIVIECRKGFYHNVENLEEPNLIVALNSGLHEFQSDDAQDTWYDSLKRLVNPRAPLVMTSYTEEELIQDLRRLEPFEMKILLGGQINPFRSLRPIRDWDSELYTPFYVNGYIAIIVGVKYFL